MNYRTIQIHPGRLPGTRDGSGLGRRIFLTGIGIACLGLIPLLQGCENAISARQEKNVNTGIGAVPHGARPPIDVAASAKTETATFALG